MHIINCGISFSIIIKTTYLQAMMTALNYTTRNLIKVFILTTDKEPKKNPFKRKKTRYPPNIKLNHETNPLKSQCHQIKNQRKDTNLFSGEGAVSIEIIHESKGTAFHCCNTFFFIFHFHSNQHLHFLECLVHLLHFFSRNKQNPLLISIWVSRVFLDL